MTSDPKRDHRRDIRLKDYDYSESGAYFVTICQRDRVSLFGEIVEGEMRSNEAGRTVLDEWSDLPNRFPLVELDAFVVMPNHLHGVIVIIANPTADVPGHAKVGHVVSKTH